MRHPVDFTHPTGKTLAATFRDTSGVVLASQAMTEDGATGYYYITAATLAAPTLPAGTYTVIVSDSIAGPVGTGVLRWDGTAELVLASQSGSGQLPLLSDLKPGLLTKDGQLKAAQ